MEARLTEIYRNEVLMYLGYRGGEIPDEIQNQIQNCMELMLKTARPRVTWQLFDRMPDGTLAGTTLKPKGKDVAELLKDCRQVILMGATLGMEAEVLLRRKQTQNMTDAVILDCCGSSAIENVCDNLCTDLQKEFEPRYLTDRFSPGYGDLPFAQQPEFIRVLDLPRRIGVTLSQGGLMIPQKSVTALIGVADIPQTMRQRGCAHCSSFAHCDYRKEGKTCGNF